jgi:hypothetical protein
MKGQTAMLSIALLLQDEGMSVGRILSDIPHDIAAFIIYVLIGGSVYLIWRGGRPKPKQ